ncbi:hypothetical protein LINGRAPRIM_LOCUS1656, partial [Linum grandiflorum]
MTTSRCSRKQMNEVGKHEEGITEGIDADKTGKTVKFLPELFVLASARRMTCMAIWCWLLLLSVVV